MTPTHIVTLKHVPGESGAMLGAPSLAYARDLAEGYARATFASTSIASLLIEISEVCDVCDGLGAYHGVKCRFCARGIADIVETRYAFAPRALDALANGPADV